MPMCALQLSVPSTTHCKCKHARLLRVDFLDPPDLNTLQAQVANNPSWKKTARTEPKCIFIDLGAADGNTFAKFLESLAKAEEGMVFKTGGMLDTI